LSGLASDAGVPVPVETLGTEAQFGLSIPDLSVIAGDAGISVPVGSSRTNAGIAVRAEGLAIGAGRNQSAGSLEEYITSSATASVELTVPDQT
jgi:hypothetical protein